MATIQLPEGYTVRKVGNSLKVVPMRRKKVVIAKEKAMLKAVRTLCAKEFDWQESLKDTVLANKDVTFTADEMYAALESVCNEDEYLDSKQQVITRLNFLCAHTLQIRLEKVAEQTYKFRHIG
jgi:hypothetical protein